ncbi:MAG: cupredoxin domain-containing protein [Myxococcaceae bacterium]
MPLVSKLVKPLLALTLAAALMWGTQAVAAGKKPAPATDAKALAPRTVKMTVTEKGYEPSPLTVKKGEPLRLLITRTTDKTCATEIVIPDAKVNTALPLNKEVEVTFTPEKAGTLTYGCAMGMMIAGVFKVE